MMLLNLPNQVYVKRLFSNIAKDYDRLNQIISIGMHHRWRKFAISKAQLTPPKSMNSETHISLQLTKNNENQERGFLGETFMSLRLTKNDENQERVFSGETHMSLWLTKNNENQERGFSDERKLVLDLCTGTADFAICAAKENNQVKVIGIDFCDEMLEIGKWKIRKQGLEDRIELKKQDISSLSFEHNSFDVVTIGFGLRHLNIYEIFKEIHRGLKPNGRLIILETAKPKGLVTKRLHKIYFYYLLPLLGKIFHGDKESYDYLPKSLDLYLPDKEDIKKLIENAGFVNVEYFDLCLGFVAVHLGVKNSSY